MTCYVCTIAKWIPILWWSWQWTFLIPLGQWTPMFVISLAQWTPITVTHRMFVCWVIVSCAVEVNLSWLLCMRWTGRATSTSGSWWSSTQSSRLPWRSWSCSTGLLLRLHGLGGSSGPSSSRLRALRHWTSEACYICMNSFIWCSYHFNFGMCFTIGYELVACFCLLVLSVCMESWSVIISSKYSGVYTNSM